MPATWFEVAITIILLAWSLLTALNQLDFHWLDGLRAQDQLGLLPRWRFFDRETGQVDYRLFYRQRDHEGRLSGWREIQVTESRRPWHCVWNPEKRSVKVLTDICSALLGSQWRHEKAVAISLPYLLLLNVVCHVEICDTAARRQFMITSTSGRRSTAPLQMVFRSAIHAMDERGDPWKA